MPAILLLDAIPPAWSTTETPAGVPADSLSIEQCVAIARAHAPAVAAASLDRSSAMFDSIATGANARPAWSIDAGGTLAPQGFYDPTITNLGDYEAKLGVAWTLADGGQRARARRRSGLDVATTRWQAALAARDAGLGAAALAARLLRLQEAIATQRADLEWFDRLATLVRSGVTAGARGASDSVRVALERDATLATLEDTELDRRSTTSGLLNALGYERDTTLAIRSLGDDGATAPDAADSARVMATIARRPELQLQRVSEAGQRIALLDASHRNAATVELAADAGLEGADLTHVVPDNLRASNPDANFADRLRRDMGASLALHFHLPLLDRAQRPSIEARREAVDAAQVRLTGEQMAQRRQALAELDQWNTAARQLDAAEASRARAERNLLRVKSLYGGGATNLFDLLDAWHTLRDARERVAAAREQYRLARFQVEDRR